MFALCEFGGILAYSRVQTLVRPVWCCCWAIRPCTFLPSANWHHSLLLFNKPHYHDSSLVQLLSVKVDPPAKQMIIHEAMSSEGKNCTGKCREVRVDNMLECETHEDHRQRPNPYKKQEAASNAQSNMSRTQTYNNTLTQLDAGIALRCSDRPFGEWSLTISHYDSPVPTSS